MRPSLPKKLALAALALSMSALGSAAALAHSVPACENGEAVGNPHCAPDHGEHDHGDDGHGHAHGHHHGLVRVVRGIVGTVEVRDILDVGDVHVEVGDVNVGDVDVPRPGDVLDAVDLPTPGDVLDAVDLPTPADVLDAVDLPAVGADADVMIHVVAGLL